MDIGQLTGTIKLEDQLSSGLQIVIGHVKEFAGELEGALGAAAVVAGAAATAIGAVTGAIIALGVEGSTLNDVEHSFDRLAAAAGTTGDALRGGLSAGVKGTITDMELMRSTTRLLSSGMKLTEDQALLMGEAARAMGKATGTDATQGLQTLSNALLTGRVRSLQMAGVTVDLKSAEEKFATSIGATREELNREGKLHADRIAIFEATKSWLDRMGTSELSFKERVQQAGVAITEFGEHLAQSVASSPHVLAAYDAIKDALVKTFGGSTQDMLGTIVGWVNRFADAVAHYGPMVIQSLVDIAKGVYDIWTRVRQAWTDAPEWFKNLSKEAVLTGGSVYIAKGAIDAITGGDVIGRLANLAQIWSTIGPAVLKAKDAVIAMGAVQVAALLNPWVLTLGAIAAAAIIAYEKVNDLNTMMKDLAGQGGGKGRIGGTPPVPEAKDAGIGLDQFSVQMDKSGKAVVTLDGFLTRLNKTLGDSRQQFLEDADATKEYAKYKKAALEDVVGSVIKINEEVAKLEERNIDKLEAEYVAESIQSMKENLDQISNIIGEQSTLVDEMTKRQRPQQISGGPGLGPLKKTFQEQTFATDLFGGVPGAIQAAIQGGGSKLQAAGGAIGSAIFGKDSKLTGVIQSGIDGIFGAGGIVASTLGNMVPIIGPLLGPLAGGLAKLFGPSEESKYVSPERDKFFKQMGGLDALNPKIQAITGNLKEVQAVFDAKTVDQYNAAVKTLKDTLAEFDGKVKDAAQSIEDLGGRFSHLTRISPELQTALEGAFNAKNIDDFGLALQDVNGVMDEQAAKQAHLVDLMNEYNLSASDLGPAFAQGQIDEASKKLIDDWTLLSSLGGNNDAILKGMAGSFSHLAQQAKESGSEIPSSLKGPLQKLQEMGLLVDENGKKFEDLSGLKFGTTLEESMAGIQTTLDTLNQTLHDMPGNFVAAFANIPTPTVRVKYDTSGLAEAAANEAGGYAGGGVVYAARGAHILPFVPRGTDTVPAMLSPGERVLTPSQSDNYESLLAGTGADGTTEAIGLLRHDLNTKLPRAMSRAVRDGLVEVRALA